MKISARYSLVISILLLFTLSCSLTSKFPISTEISNVNQVTETPKGQVMLPAVATITAGDSHACVIRNKGEVFCWGDNSYGQLGDGTWNSHSTMVKVEGLENIVTIAAGTSYTCAVTEEGTVKCWGRNESGQLGDGTLNMSNLPINVTGLTSKVVAISAGDSHTCAVTVEGEAKCWGKNLYGRLGDGTRSLRSKTPVNVIGLNNKVTFIGAGYEHTCALLNNGSVKCWGLNSFGQLGTGGNEALSAIPVDVPNLDNAVSAITVGFNQTCVLLKSGHVKCWGWIGPQGFSEIPTDIRGIENVTAIATGGDHTCAIKSDNSVYCWGNNEAGELGNDSTSSSNAPVKVLNMESGVKMIATGFHFACGLLNNGIIKCWGDNSAGQLGNNSTENSSIPVDVESLP